ncbi:hypothetical protein BDP81DRAFT_453117 [Colletotrichum phormii]|uniref:Nephrocystin 3-like N-terminal domain-containing protein n=1 Tax=Colletotrichum phormii TaxID=359342 RepID=A0AAJ0EAL2_9PEZI|nr:uncharacterized protein BDP81DRAFT_453117 [Colletotrichum phormii]KAK1625199.1 hypothetical protein BDP81DRAFT_453117 [Colletotrichum phormii]
MGCGSTDLLPCCRYYSANPRSCLAKRREKTARTCSECPPRAQPTGSAVQQNEVLPNSLSPLSQTFLSDEKQQKTERVPVTPRDMAGAIGTAASVVGLVGALLKTVHEIRKAREHVKNPPKRLDDISSTLETISRYLKAIVEELHQLFKRLQEKIQRRKFPRFTKALVTQDADETEAAYISNRLANATAELGTRINVAVKLLEGINSKVHQDTNLSDFTDPEFLSNLSSVHSSIDAAYFRHFYQTSAKPFDCGELVRNLKDRKGKPFVFVDHETGLGHSMFTFSITLEAIQDHSSQRENPKTCTKWVLTGKLSDSLRERLSGLGREADTTEILLKASDVAAAFGLQEAIPRIIKTAAVWGNFMEHGVTAQAHFVNNDLSWFRYCKPAQSWCARPTDSRHDSRMLWLRKGPHSSLASNAVGFEVASGMLLDKEELPIVAYFSFATFEAGANQSPTSRQDFHEQTFQAQVAWCIVAQLLRRQYGPESSLAETLLRLPPMARETLISTCSAIGESKYPFKPTPDGNDPASPLGLTWSHLSEVTTVMSAYLEDITQDGKCVVLVLDGLEHQYQSACAKLVTWIDKLGHGVRALLCIDDTREFTTGGQPRWSEVTSNAPIVDKTTEWRECIESLKFDDMHQRRDQIADPLPAINQWLWETEEFQQWESSGKILWIMGRAGSGKSVLAKNIQQNFQRKVSNGDLSGDLLVCDWFYSARGPTFGAKDASMLRALTLSILSSDKKTVEPARAVYRARFDAGRQDHDWLLSELSDLFTALALSPSTPRTLAVVDALDESESVTESSSLKSTHENFDLLEMFTEIGGSQNSRVRFVLLSRPEFVISKTLSNCPQIRMEQYNDLDISIVIEGGIEKLRMAWRGAPDTGPTNFSKDSNASTNAHSRENPSSNNDLETQEKKLGEIRAHLETHAKGVILWVIRIIQQLLLLIENEIGFSTQNLMDSLIASPPEVEELYIKFLESLRGSRSTKELAKTKIILEWIVGSQRRASLRLIELREILAISNQLEMGKHEEFSHDSLDPHRMILYCGPFIEILDDQQRFRLDSRHEIGDAKQDWTIQLSHQTVNSFLQTPSRSGEFHIDPASAEGMVTTQTCRYLGIRASSPGQMCYQITAEGEGDPILALKVALAPLLRNSSLLATKQYAESTKRPFAKFALDVILKSCPDNEAIFGTLMTADSEGLASRDWVAVRWLTDMCFTPTFPGTILEPFIFFCCVHGQTEALKTFSTLKDECSGEYETRLMANGRSYQIICGAVEAFIKVREDNDTCLAARTLETLHTL